MIHNAHHTPSGEFTAAEGLHAPAFRSEGVPCGQSLPTALKAELTLFMAELVEASAQIISAQFLQPNLEVYEKPDGSSVSTADRVAESCMRELIHKRYPQHGIIGEEFGSEVPGAEFVWVIDPIDGTKEFIRGQMGFGTLIGLLYRGEPNLGLFNQPLLGEQYIGDGSATYRSSTKVMMSSPDCMRSSKIMVEQGHGARWDFWHERVKALENSCAMRIPGISFHGCSFALQGGVDIVVEGEVEPWDILPLVPLIRGAGGEISSLDGGPAEKAADMIYAPKTIHAQALRILG